MSRPGRHFLQIPGPTNVPDRVLRAMAAPVVDHRGPAFAVLGRAVLDGMRALFQTRSHVIIYPSSGTGACEAALANALSPPSSTCWLGGWNRNSGDSGAGPRNPPDTC